MSYETYRAIFVACAVLAAMCLIIAIGLFFFLKIREVVGYLTGSTMRKGIENISTQTENSKGAQKQSISEALGSHNRPQGSQTPQNDPNAPAYDPVDRTNETVILNPDGKDGSFVRGAKKTEEAATAILSQNKDTGSKQEKSTPQNDDSFMIEYELTFIHTEEIIV